MPALTQAHTRNEGFEAYIATGRAGDTVGFHVFRAYPLDRRIAWGDMMWLENDVTKLDIGTYRALQMELVLRTFHTLASASFVGYACAIEDPKLRHLAVDNGPAPLFKSIPRLYADHGVPFE